MHALPASQALCSAQPTAACPPAWSSEGALSVPPARLARPPCPLQMLQLEVYRLEQALRRERRLLPALQAELAALQRARCGPPCMHRCQASPRAAPPCTPAAAAPLPERLVNPAACAPRLLRALQAAGGHGSPGTNLLAACGGTARPRGGHGPGAPERERPAPPALPTGCGPLPRVASFLPPDVFAFARGASHLGGARWHGPSSSCGRARQRRQHAHACLPAAAAARDLPPWWPLSASP